MLHLILQNIIWFILNTLRKTWKFEVVNYEVHALAKSKHPQGAYLQAFWHENFLAYATAQAWSGPFLGMVSKSKDGDYAAFVMRKMGFTPVRGSSRGRRGGDKGGKAAMEVYVSELIKGASGGITVDGPKGPRRVCKPGIVLIAEQTGAVIVPGIAVGQKYWEINSWDKFKIPKPFTRIKVVYGDIVVVPHGSSQHQIVECCRQIETKLIELEKSVKWK